MMSPRRLNAMVFAIVQSLLFRAGFLRILKEPTEQKF
jgi:hypothetical protein